MCVHYRPLFTQAQSTNGRVFTLELQGQWCHDMANGVGRFQHGDGDAPWIHATTFFTTETQKPFWQISKLRLNQIQIRKHRLKGGGFISPFCVGFISIAARLSGPVRTIFLLKRECSIVQQVTAVTTVTTGTGTLFAYVNLQYRLKLQVRLKQVQVCCMYVSCRYRRIVFLLPWTYER